MQISIPVNAQDLWSGLASSWPWLVAGAALMWFTMKGKRTVRSWSRRISSLLGMRFLWRALRKWGL